MIIMESKCRVNFSMALLAKSAGFNEPTMVYYDCKTRQPSFVNPDDSFISRNWTELLLRKDFIPAPNKERLFLWLIEQGVVISRDYIQSGSGNYWSCKIVGNGKEFFDSNYNLAFDEALEEGLHIVRTKQKVV